MIHIIVAIDRFGGIGRGGDMLFHIREDLKRFKKLTMGGALVMGRKTFESLPNGALPGRRNIVVTRNPEYTAPGIEVAGSLDDALAMAANGNTDTFVIGGGEIYAQAMSKADILDITSIDAVGEGADTFFPAIPLDEFVLADSEEGETIPAVRFLTFKRLTPGQS